MCGTIPPPPNSFMAFCLIEHKENFIFVHTVLNPFSPRNFFYFPKFAMCCSSTSQFMPLNHTGNPHNNAHFAFCCSLNVRGKPGVHRSVVVIDYRRSAAVAYRHTDPLHSHWAVRSVRMQIGAAPFVGFPTRSLLGRRTGWKTGVRFPLVQDFSLLLSASYSICTRDSFPGGKAAGA
jgi:hypothetical protein